MFVDPMTMTGTHGRDDTSLQAEETFKPLLLKANGDGFHPFLSLFRTFCF